MCEFQKEGVCSGASDMKVIYEGDVVPICIECKNALEAEGRTLPRSDMPYRKATIEWPTNEPGHAENTYSPK